MNEREIVALEEDHRLEGLQREVYRRGLRVVKHNFALSSLFTADISRGDLCEIRIRDDTCTMKYRYEKWFFHRVTMSERHYEVHIVFLKPKKNGRPGKTEGFWGWNDVHKGNIHKV